MTLALRSTFITFSSLLAFFLIVIGFIFGLPLIINYAEFSPILNNIQTGWLWWTNIDNVPPFQLQTTIIITLFLSVFGFISLLILTRYFRKTASTEIFFFSLYLFSLSIMTIRLIGPYLLVNNYSLELIGWVTRMFIFARLLGIFFLLLASLYAAGFNYQNYSTLIGVFLLLSLLISGNIPINDYALTSTLLSIPGDKITLGIFILSIELITVITFFVGAYIKVSSDYLIIAISALSLIIGQELLIMPSNIWVPVCGAIFLIIGTIIYSRRLHQVYLWM